MEVFSVSGERWSIDRHWEVLSPCGWESVYPILCTIFKVQALVTLVGKMAGLISNLRQPSWNGLFVCKYIT